MDYQIFVKVNKSYTFMVNDKTTINDLYTLIKEKIKIPKENYYLLFNGKIIDSNNNFQKLSDYSIFSENTIHLVIRSVPNSLQINK